MKRYIIDFIIWSLIILGIGTWAGWSRGRMEGFKVGYETGWQCRNSSRFAPSTINLWE